MKSICFFLIGVFLVYFSRAKAVVVINSVTQNEINRRLHVRGAMGGNITLMSNSSLGSGSLSYVLTGETNDGTSVAIKATPPENLEKYTQEYKCFEKMNATMDKVCEKYGIPYIYHSGDFLDNKMMVMTMLDFELDSLQRRIGSFSKDTILIIFRDMIKTLKFVHSKGIIHKDIHLGNIMTKGGNVFLTDFNSSIGKGLNHDIWNKLFNKDFDMRKLFAAMSKLMGMNTYCYAEKKLGPDEKKRKMKEEFLFEKIKYTELIEPYVEFCIDAIEVEEKKRLPNYDYLYKLFDDVLYTGRNRSERIVFEWLTIAERAVAMAESIPSIESIVFPEENSH